MRAGGAMAGWRACHVDALVLVCVVAVLLAAVYFHTHDADRSSVRRRPYAALHAVMLSVGGSEADGDPDVQLGTEDLDPETIADAAATIDMSAVSPPTQVERAGGAPLFRWGERVVIDTRRLGGKANLKHAYGQGMFGNESRLVNVTLVPAMVGCVQARGAGEKHLYGLRVPRNGLPSVSIIVAEDVILGHLQQPAPAEAAALAALQRDLGRHVGPAADKQRRSARTLCAVFVTDDDLQRETVLGNMMHMGSQCDWAILSYTDDIALWHSVRQRAQQRLGDALVFRLFANADLGRGKYHPKPVLYRHFLALVDVTDYGYLWLLDADIAVPSINLRLMVDTARHVFGSPLLVAQPSISPMTQFMDYLNTEFWRNTKAVAVETSYVEQQAPLIDARFFQWFVDSVLQVRKADTHGSDWGFDDCWCFAARAYGRVVLGPDTGSVPICGVLPSNVAIHANAHAITKTKEYFEGGRFMLHEYERMFPNWLTPDHCGSGKCGRPDEFLSCKVDRQYESQCNRQALCEPEKAAIDLAAIPELASLIAGKRRSSGTGSRRRRRR